MSGLTLRLALRNLFRNRWRSLLTAGGIAVAVTLVVWATGMAVAFEDAMVRSFTDGELGSIQVHSPEYVKERSLFYTMDVDADRIAKIQGVAGVSGASGRIQAFGLVGHSTHSQVAKVMGVVPQDEAKVTVTASRVKEGAWLSDAPAPPPAAREVVLGKILAKQLKVAPGDELVIFLTGADGSLGNDLLKVQGIVETGNGALDRMAVYMHLADAQYLTALDGRVHEIAVNVEVGADLNGVAHGIRGALGDTMTVRTWKQVMPEMSALMEASRSSMYFFYLVIYAITALGILNTQRMTALERRREFGVLMAIGTAPGRLARTVLAESVALSVSGALLGGGLGLLINHYFATSGWDLAALNGGKGVDYMGVTIDVLYFHSDWTLLLWPVLCLSVVGLLCGIWPAISSARVNVPAAIAGRN